jgi:hypothetical protein
MLDKFKVDKTSAFVLSSSQTDDNDDYDGGDVSGGGGDKNITQSTKAPSATYLTATP